MKWRPRPVEVIPVLASAVLLAGAVLTVAGSPSQMPTPDPSPFGNRQTALASHTAAVPTPETFINPAQPVRLQIPTLGITARILPVGMDQERNVAVPENIDDVGWYRYGVSAGTSQGSVVLVAHRDGRIGGAGVFYDLGSLGRNDRITVTDEAGTRWQYRVIARELVAKSSFAVQAEDFFERDGPPRLTLITCGGAYVRQAGGYQGNVVVTAVPVMAQPDTH